jgi:hypothetical protein
MAQRHAIANARRVPCAEIRPGAVVRLRDPEGRVREGVVHHLNAFQEPFILPSEAVVEPFYAHPADIEEVLGFHPELMGPHTYPERTARRRRLRPSGRRHRAR